MREIKFRGKIVDIDKYAYGDLRRGQDGFTYVDSWRVFPDSVSQLVGVDENGDEVYEGDKLLDKDGWKYEAVLQGLMVGCWSGAKDSGVSGIHLARKISDG